MSTRPIPSDHARKRAYLWAVKANQPEPKRAIADALAPSAGAVCSPHERRLRRDEQPTASSVNKGHGRIEHRKLTSTTALNRSLDWPGVKPVFRLQRRRTTRGRTATETAYGVTRLPRGRADAAKLLALTRDHWGIENRLFDVRDVTFGEDTRRVRTGHAPRLLAARRNLAITLLNRAGKRNKAAALRRHAVHPHEAPAPTRGSPENSTAPLRSNRP